MHVDGAARIPAWIDRREIHGALRVRRLESAQEFLPLRVELRPRVREIRVHTERIALPEIDDGAGERSTRAGRSHLREAQRKPQRHSGAHSVVTWIRADV